MTFLIQTVLNFVLSILQFVQTYEIPFVRTAVSEFTSKHLLK